MNAPYTDKENAALDALPVFYTHNGRGYSRTFKTGRDIATGTASCEYRYTDGEIDSRIWIDIDGNVTEDD